VTILVLDSGAVTDLSENRSRVAELRRLELWPPHVPAVVLAEALTGDHRRDFHVNRLLKACTVREVTEWHARQAALLRTAALRSRAVSAVDSLVVAYASAVADPIVLTSDQRDLVALAEHAAELVRVVAV
jgi:predicted nucleic acid-binding protein